MRRTPEQRVRINARRRERYRTDPEYRAKKIAAQRHYEKTHREKIAAYRKDMRNNPEWIAKRREYEKRRKAILKDHIAEVDRAYHQRPEVRERAKARARWRYANDPEFKERVTAWHNKPESKDRKHAYDLWRYHHTEVGAKKREYSRIYKESRKQPTNQLLALGILA